MIFSYYSLYYIHSLFPFLTRDTAGFTSYLFTESLFWLSISRRGSLLPYVRFIRVSQNLRKCIKYVTFLCLSVNFCNLNFFLEQTLDIFSAYWIFCHVKKSRKLVHCENYRIYGNFGCLCLWNSRYSQFHLFVFS